MASSVSPCLGLGRQAVTGFWDFNCASRDWIIVGVWILKPTGGRGAGLA